MFKSFQSTELFVTLWTVVHQAPLSMAFPRQQHWSGLPGIEPVSPALQADSFITEPQGKHIL